MRILLTLCKSLKKFLSPKFEIPLETQGNIHWFCRIFSRLLNISSVFYTIFPQTLQLVTWIYDWHSVKVWRSFYVPKLRYHLKHKEIYTDFVVFLPDYLISPQFFIRFSPDSTISYMGIWMTFCKSLKKFLCPKVEIWLRK